MLPKATIPGWKDKVLFTPGPLTTSRTVKQAMLRDLGSRDFEFIELVKDIRCKLVALGQAAPEEYTTVLMQGSGTFGLEAVVSSTVPPDGKLLVIVNGAYGKRLAKMASVLKIETLTLEYPEHTTPALEQVEAGSPDLVVLDLQMPRMDGINTLERMAALSLRPPVVVYSAYYRLRDNPVARTADAYVVKRSDLSALKREIERVLHLQTCG